MAKVAIRAKQTSTTPGQGAYDLIAAPYGWSNFLADSNINSGDQVFYLATDVDFDGETGKWEVGIGTITSGTPDTLSRDTILLTSNGDQTAISWGVGTRDIVGILPSEGIMIGANNLSDVGSATTARTNLGLGSAATKNEGAGSTLNADQVDGFHASAFVRKTVANVLTGNNEFDGTSQFDGVCTFNADADFSAGRLILPRGTNLGV